MSAVLQARRLVGVGLKMYFDHRRAGAWLAEVRESVGIHPAVQDGRVGVFVLPSFTALSDARRSLETTRVEWGGQNLSWADAGPYTGEVGGAELAQLGCTVVEVGHAERRRLFAEDDAIVGSKLDAAHRNALTPVLCVGETDPIGPERAAAECVRQLRATTAAAKESGTAGPIIVAYEPVWAIGAAEPAGAEHVRAVMAALSEEIGADAQLTGSRLIYGGSARAGLLEDFGDAVDGLFLGRAAHDVKVLCAVIDEAAR